MKVLVLSGHCQLWNVVIRGGSLTGLVLIVALYRFPWSRPPRSRGPSWCQAWPGTRRRSDPWCSSHDTTVSKLTNYVQTVDQYVAKKYIKYHTTFILFTFSLYWGLGPGEGTFNDKFALIVTMTLLNTESFHNQMRWNASTHSSKILISKLF